MLSLSPLAFANMSTLMHRLLTVKILSRSHLVSLIQFIIVTVVCVRASPVNDQLSTIVTPTEAFTKDLSQRLDNRRERVNVDRSAYDDLLERFGATTDDVDGLQSVLKYRELQLGRFLQSQQLEADAVMRETFWRRISEEIEQIWRLVLNRSSEPAQNQQENERRHAMLIKQLNETRGELKAKIEHETLLAVSYSNVSVELLMRELNELQVLAALAHRGLESVNGSLLGEIRRSQTEDETASSARRIILERVEKLNEVANNISFEQRQQQEFVREDHREIMSEVKTSMSGQKQLVEHLTRHAQMTAALNSSLSLLHDGNSRTQNDIEKLEKKLNDRLFQLEMNFSQEMNQRQARLEETLRNISFRATGNDRRFGCDLDIVAYSADSPDCSSSSSRPNYGYVKVNNGLVWEAGWCTTKPNLRGINTMILQPTDCSVSDVRRFDTYLNEVHHFIAYLGSVRNETLLIGVTGDEPTNGLAPALPRLRSAGVDVADVQYRGSFAFVIQIGFPENTVFVKSTTNARRNVELRTSISGITRDMLRITRV